MSFVSTDLTDKVIRDYGVIARMALPERWIEDAHNDDDTADIMETRCFRAPEFSEVALYLKFSGRPNPAAARKAWMKLIESEDLSPLYARDIQDISPILGDVADAELFELTNAHVQDWNGKRILFVEGRFKEQSWRCVQLFVDIYDDGEYTQQITFGAPDMVYDAFVQTAVCAMQTISWQLDVVKSLPSAD
jgi:hypothetical protein